MTVCQPDSSIVDVERRGLEVRVAALLERSSLGVAEIDAIAVRFVVVNRRFCEMLGYEEHELVGRDVVDVTHEDDRELSRGVISRLLEPGHQSQTTEKRYRRKDGSVMWATVTATALEGTGRCMALVTDITARKEAEAALRASRQELEALVRAAPVGVYQTDADGGCLFANETWSRITGLTAEEARGERWLEAIHPDDRAAVVEEWYRAIAERRAFRHEYRFGRADNTVTWVSGNAVALRDDDRLLGFVGTVTDITDQKAAEERYRRLFEDSLDARVEVGGDGIVLRANAAMANLLGVASSSAIVGTNILPLFADADATRPLFEVLRREGTINGVSTVWVKPDGERIDVEMYGRAVRDTRGEIARYHGTVRDVTGQRQQQAALRFLSTELARRGERPLLEETVFELASILGVDAVFLGTLREGPPRRLRMEAVCVDGKPVVCGDFDPAGLPAERVLRGKAYVVPSGLEALYPDSPHVKGLGATAYVAVPLRDATGKVVGSIGVLSRKPLLAASRIEGILTLFALRIGPELQRVAAEKRFTGVFEFAPDAVLIVDPRGRVVLANRAAEVTFGYTREELAAVHFADLLPSAGLTGSARTWAQRKDGSRLPVEVNLSPMDADDTRLVVAAIRDVSERERFDEERARLEDALRHAQKMESLGTLAGGIAHDFNNVLTAILANVDLARDHIDRGGTVADAFDDIAEAATRASELVKQILAFSRRQPTRRAVASVSSIVTEVARLLRATVPAGIELGVEEGADVPNVFVDPTQLHQVVMNLGTNAWQAIHRTTGHIVFRTRRVVLEAGAASVAALRPGVYAAIDVTDDGSGMDVAVAERVFEPFFTTKTVGAGTGLGLSVVHGIVAEHGGAVTVTTKPGEGSTFTVYLPEHVGQPSSAVPPPNEEPRHVGRVLYVDDEEAVVRVASRLLERLGYVVTGFVDPVQAVEAVRADPCAFDIVVTDQNMPGLSGGDVARALEGIRADLPVILASGNWGYALPDDAHRNVVCRLDKPFKSGELARVIGLALRR